VKDIIKLKFIIISISTIITICAYSSISVNSSQLAPTIENLVPNFWTCKNGTVGTSLAPLAGRWHGFFFLIKVINNYYFKTNISPLYIAALIFNLTNYTRYIKQY
jgi:hypothetical protein